jgi:hypothetical protein
MRLEREFPQSRRDQASAPCPAVAHNAHLCETSDPELLGDHIVARDLEQLSKIVAR